MISKLSILRPVSTVMVVLMVFLGGFVAKNNLEIAFMPSIEYPVMMVGVSYDNAGPQEVEELITKPLEKALSTVTDVKNITSYSSMEYSQVSIEFNEGADLDEKTNEVRDKLETVYLPDDADKPSIFKYDLENATNITVGITSEKYNSYSLYNFVDSQLKNRFERINGASAVEIWGGQWHEVDITVDPLKLNGYGITIDDISNALSAENRNFSAGNVTQGESTMDLRALGEFKTVDEIKEIPILTSKGNMVYIKDVADVEMVQKDSEMTAIINGVEGIILSISKQSDANIVTVSDSINQEIDSIQAEYPDVHVQILNSTADYITKAIDGITETAFQSAIVAVLILLLFLRDWKSALVIGVSIPASIMATFAMMYITGITMNMISTGGIVIGIGMLVDNSVVVLENINTYHQRGYKPYDAALKGTQEVAMAVTASTLTSVAVFLPIAFVPGTIGSIVKDLSYTICYALLASLVVSITFVPMACSKLLSRQDRRKKIRRTIITAAGDLCLKFLNALDKWYRKLLNMALRHRIKTVVIVVACFILSLGTFPFLTSNLMGETDEGTCSVYISLPEGTKYEKTEEVLYKALNLIGDVPETDIMAAMASGRQANIDYVFVDKTERDRSTIEIANDIKSKIQNMAGVDIYVTGAGSAMGSMGGGELYLEITGEDQDVLRDVGKDIVDIVKTIPGAENVESSLDDSVAEGNIRINRAKAAKYGISTSSVANAVSAAVDGVTATTIKENGTETDVVIKYADDSVKYLSDVKNMIIPTSDGRFIPITEVVDFSVADSATTIRRENMKRVITVTGNISGMDMSDIQKAVTEKLNNYIFPEGVSYSFGGSMETMNEMIYMLTVVMIVSVLLVYMIMASQFESLLYPFIIMFSMPIAITGGMLGLFLTRQSINAMSMLGFIMLIGMVVNNAIVLVDYTNKLRAEKGLGYNEALVEAGPARLRPILMTTLTTIIGIFPMVFSQSSGMETQRPLGVVIIFGLTLSTVITLVFIPVLYSLVTGFENKIKAKFHKIESKFYYDSPEEAGNN